MVRNVKEVGPQRYRETFGRYFEDFIVGDVYEHRPGKTITEYENHMFTLMTLNTHPMHFDSQFAAASEFKKNLVVSFSIDNRFVAVHIHSLRGCIIIIIITIEQNYHD
jgi:hypothetical protein